MAILVENCIFHPVYITPPLRRFPLKFRNGSGAHENRVTLRPESETCRYVHSIQCNTGIGRTEEKQSYTACSVCWRALKSHTTKHCFALKIKQEAQLMLTNTRDAFRGQSWSQNMVPYDMLGMTMTMTMILLDIVAWRLNRYMHGQKHWT